jgi:excisionase family DNA binding protein
VSPSKPHKAPLERRLLTVREVAAYLRLHTSTIYRLLKTNQIPAFKVGSDWRFNLETIDAWRFGLERNAAHRRNNHP